MSKKLIIFDLDGTLLDTSEDLMDSMNAMLTEYGFENITLTQAKAYIGNGARNFVLRSLPDDKKQLVDEALIRYNAIYNGSGSPRTRLYCGIDKVLLNAKASGAMIAIASNKPQKSTDEVYAKYLKQFDFDYVYGNREGFSHKPDRECGELILRALDARAEDTLVVGDGETDVKFAQNLGAACVAVTWGYRSAVTLEKEGAEIFAANTSELDNIIHEFIKKRS